MTGSKIYANAVAKYDEGRLLDAEKLRRIAEASYTDALRMLYDYGYGEGLPVESADVDSLTAIETNKLVSFVREYAPSEPLKLFLLAGYVYNNAEAAYKSRFAGVDDAAFYGGAEGKKAALSEDGEANFYPALTAATARLDAIAEREPLTSARIDAEFSAAMYDDLLRLGKKTGKRTYAYIKRKIDLTNILTVYRLSRSGGDPSAPVGTLIAGGTLDIFDPASLAANENGAAPGTGEYEPLTAALYQGGDVAAYERAADEYAAESLEGDRENMLSFEPFIGYFFAKKAEIAAVRLVLTCVRNDARGEIARRLRKVE